MNQNNKQFNLPHRQHQQLIDEESDSSNNIPINLGEITIDEKKAQNHEKINISGVEIYFPQKPYSVQEDYMKHLIQALEKKENALLQSPTGTGKTLALLCASLAWLRKQRMTHLSKVGKQKEIKQSVKIIYASRTHAQLKQVAKELKATVYQPKICILGSRDQLCIRKEFQNLKGAFLNLECKKMVKQKLCQFYEKDKFAWQAQEHSQLIMDIEELKQFGNHQKICPFYFERFRKDNSDFILMPYNYLLEKDFSDMVDVKNCIIIFDEAHNIQANAEEGSSFQVHHKYIVDGANELQGWIDNLDNFSSDILTTRLKDINIPFDMRDYRRILITMKIFAQYLEQIKSVKELQGDTTVKYLIKEGNEILQFVKDHTCDQDNFYGLNGNQTNFSNGITKENIQKYLQISSIIIDVMNESHSSTAYHFEGWIRFINHIYKLLLEEDSWIQTGGKVQSFSNPINTFRLVIQKDKEENITVQMWCLDPSLSFQRLVKRQVYNMILASGTLAPFESWSSELRIPFQVQLANEHVINVQKSVLGCVSNSFNFSYDNRDDESQVARMGTLLLNLSKVIPNGILVIFASYILMNKMRQKWFQSKILLRINELKKCFWEPQNTSEMIGVFADYSFEAKRKGAILFAVQRGKVAEGIDFSDDLCRGVVLIGVPYPPNQDKKIVEKKQYLEKIYNDPEFQNQKRIRSNQWYVQQAIRSMNQAIGRVIRHVSDYGAVYLCDSRFDFGDIKQGISSWIKPAIKQWNDDAELYVRTSKFFTSISSNGKVVQFENANFQQFEQPQRPQQKRNPIQYFGLQNKQKIQELEQEKSYLQQKIKEIDRNIYIESEKKDRSNNLQEEIAYPQNQHQTFIKTSSHFPQQQEISEQNGNQSKNKKIKIKLKNNKL